MTAPAILADDLTGALDTAAQFTGRWGEIVVHLGAADRPLPPPCAVSSETRELAKTEAVVRSLSAASQTVGVNSITLTVRQCGSGKRLLPGRNTLARWSVSCLS